MSAAEIPKKIQQLNDAFRTTATFTDFSAANDPHKEHDFGSFTLAGRKFFFKLDLYEECFVKSLLA
jgi:hypothetical protein